MFSRSRQETFHCGNLGGYAFRTASHKVSGQSVGAKTVIAALSAIIMFNRRRRATRGNLCRTLYAILIFLINLFHHPSPPPRCARPTRHSVLSHSPSSSRFYFVSEINIRIYRIILLFFPAWNLKMKKEIYILSNNNREIFA